MRKYGNSNHSGIVAYETEDDFIKVKFKSNDDLYVYSKSRISSHHIEKMKALAKNGEGLATYINKHPEVKNNYMLCININQ